MLIRVLSLIKILESHGSWWTLENPLTSYIWSMPGTISKMSEEACFTVVFDQCSYGLKLRNREGQVGPCKKATRIIGNIPTLTSLHKVCSCDQKHVHAVGGVRTPSGWKSRSKLAGCYPLQLCDAYAKAVHGILPI